ncbi:hypothetical protein BN889_05042 [Pseudomonas aeruginosa PA38182]|nr:hypothetical protein BN889_05042 [Pseudomonas aeruginosa PA38182]
MTAASGLVQRGNSNTGASQMVLSTMALRKPEKPLLPEVSRSSWVMPEKNQKNRNSQPRPAQSMRLRVTLGGVGDTIASYDGPEARSSLASMKRRG